MNKKELIGILEGLEGDSFIEKYNEGYDQAVCDCLVAAKQLDEPKKVIFSHEEKFVADWINDLKGRISDNKLSSGAAFMVFVGQQLECLYYNEYTLITDDIEGWLLHPENKVKLQNAIDNGYEVEKEQLYYVKMPGVGYLNNADGGIKHTEQEIKAIDERYLAFAVKVDGE